MKWFLALGYLHVIFKLKARSHLAKSELLHATKMKGDKRAFSFRETNYVSKFILKSQSQTVLILHSIFYYRP